MELTEILDQKGVYYKKTNNPSELLIACTSGLHDDTNPSLQYNLDSNIFHCWACDFSGGSSKFLSSIGIVTKLPLESKQPYKIRKLREKLRCAPRKFTRPTSKYVTNQMVMQTRISISM